MLAVLLHTPEDTRILLRGGRSKKEGAGKRESRIQTLRCKVYVSVLGVFKFHGIDHVFLHVAL